MWGVGKEGSSQRSAGTCMSVDAEESLVCLQPDLHMRTDWGAGNPPLFFFFETFSSFYSSIVHLQCCISFRYKAK